MDFANGIQVETSNKEFIIIIRFYLENTSQKHISMYKAQQLWNKLT